MTTDRTVLERLDRLHRLARRADIERTDHLLDEIAAGLADLRRDLQEVLTDDVEDCVHCGSPFTFRRSDGDIGCQDCHGIMPRNEDEVTE